MTEHTVNDVEYYRGTIGDTSDTGTINRAIAAVNAGDFNLEFPARIYDLVGPLIPITARDALIRGKGPATTLRYRSDIDEFPGIGTFFRFGTDALEANSVLVEGFQLRSEEINRC